MLEQEGGGSRELQLGLNLPDNGKTGEQAAALKLGESTEALLRGLMAFHGAWPGGFNTAGRNRHARHADNAQLLPLPARRAGRSAEPQAVLSKIKSR